MAENVLKNRGSQRLTVRSFIIGLGFSALSAVMAQYSGNVVHGSSLSIDHMPVAAIFLFFTSLLFFHLLIKIIKKPLNLSSSELLGIYIMAFVGCTVSTMGLGCYLLPIIGAPNYYATSQNQWSELLLPYIRNWLIPQSKTAVAWYFEGIPKGTPIPWMVWLKPLFAWLPFLVALYLVMICIPILMRKQWVERERLQFPLAQIPIEMTKKGKNGFTLFQNKVMWFGFAIPVIISTINALHNYFPLVPPVNLSNVIPIFRNTQQLIFRVSFPVTGFIFLANTEVSFSLWFFALLTTVLSGWFNVIGISSPENMGVYGSQSAIFNHVGTGSLIALVFYTLWVARFHLREVFHKTFFRNSPVDDSNEMLPYRTSLLTILIGIICMIIWLSLSGLPPLMAFLYVILALVIFLGITRVIIEGGVPTLIAPGIAPSQLVSSIGTSALGSSGLTSLGFTFAYSGDIRTFVMSAAANSMKIAEGIEQRKKLIFWAMFLSVLINLITALGINLYLGFKYGAVNLNTWYSIAGPQVGFNFAKEKILYFPGPNRLGWLCKITGGGVMLLLLFLRSRFLWWRIHPIGCAVGSVIWIQYLWFSIFIAWLAKTFIMKYGGPKLYNNIKPFFLGLVMGQYVIAALWFLIDLLTGMKGNSIFWI